MNSNEQNFDKEKNYYIEIDGEQIPVSEEIYRAYKRPAWRERKRKQREKAKATGGPNCTYAVGATPLSINRMEEDGIDMPHPGHTVEELYILQETISALNEALEQLAPNDRAILELFGEGLSDRKISTEIGIPQTTVSYRRKVLFKALREQLKDYR